MKCPVCITVPLEIAARKGIEIDYCPECRGVWLDRGELDKIIQRSITEDAVPYSDMTDQPKRKPYELVDNSPPPPSPQDSRRRYDDDDDYDERRHDRRRRKSFFEDVFDIFD